MAKVPIPILNLRLPNVSSFLLVTLWALIMVFEASTQKYLEVEKLHNRHGLQCSFRNSKTAHLSVCQHVPSSHQKTTT